MVAVHSFQTCEVGQLVSAIGEKTQQSPKGGSANESMRCDTWAHGENHNPDDDKNVEPPRCDPIAFDQHECACLGLVELFHGDTEPCRIERVKDNERDRVRDRRCLLERVFASEQNA